MVGLTMDKIELPDLVSRVAGVKGKADFPPKLAEFIIRSASAPDIVALVKIFKDMKPAASLAKCTEIFGLATEVMQSVNNRNDYYKLRAMKVKLHSVPASISTSTFI